MSRYSIPFIFLDTFLADYLCFSLLRFTKRRFWRNSWSLFELDVIILSFRFISYGISSILEAETNTWHISVCLLNCKQPKINKIPFPLLLLFNSNYSLYNLIDKSWSTFINFVSIPIQFTKEKKLHENINTLYNIAPIRNKFSRLHNNLNPEPACQLLTSFPQTHLDFHSKRVYPLFSATESHSSSRWAAASKWGAIKAIL